VNPDRVRKVFRYLAHMYDKYVHGAYITAMELYNGETWRFMVSGMNHLSTGLHAKHRLLVSCMKQYAL
jgi:hypothetical protein